MYTALPAEEVRAKSREVTSKYDALREQMHQDLQNRDYAHGSTGENVSFDEF